MTRQGLASYTDLKTFVSDRPGHDRRYAIDASKARRELEWTPRFDLERGLARTVEWFVENREWTSRSADSIRESVRSSKNSLSFSHGAYISPSYVHIVL